MHIVILGAPGAGKGTQSKLISDEYEIPAISTGELLRNIASNPKNEVSFQIAETINKGSLVSNDLIIKVLQDRLQMQDCKKGFILDGFPRSFEQAKLMHHIMTDKGKNIIINIVVDKEILIKRLAGRFSCNSCGAIYNKFFLKPKVEQVCDICSSKDFTYRNDDEEEVIRKRMAVYEAETKPMIEYYESIKDNSYFVKSFNGEKDVLRLFNDIKLYLEKVKMRP